MTQKSRILQFLKDNTGSHRPINIAKALNIKPSSVRGRLFDLRKINVITKPFQGRTVQFKSTQVGKEKVQEILKEEEELFDREIVKVLVYCPDEPHRAGFGHKLFALTYGNDPDDDHFDDLVEALQIGEEIEQDAFDLDFNFREDRGNLSSVNKFKSCLQASTYGFDNEVQTDNPPFTFPDIEVGEE